MSNSETGSQQPISTPVDSGAIGRLNEALGAVDRARLQTAAWSTCNGGRSGVDLLYAVVEAIVREHVEAALAGVVSMDRRSTRIDTCMHCGDLVISFGDGFWSHYRGPGSLLTRCQHSVPYVKDAAPTEGGRYHRIDREHTDRALAEVEQRIEARSELLHEAFAEAKRGMGIATRIVRAARQEQS